MADPDAPPTYRFGLFEVNGASGELRKQGRRLRVRGRPIDILLILLESPGSLVTREHLRERLWAADTFVDFDHGLNTSVNRLREALGDTADNPRFVETVPRRGYRFIAPVEVVATRPILAVAPSGDAVAATGPVVVESAGAKEGPTTAPRGDRRAFFTAALATLLVTTLLGVWIASRALRSAPDKLTIAVLPFENLSGDREQEFFSDGFTDEMIAELGMLDPQRLGVIARTTSMLYKGAQKNVGQIGHELGVKYVLAGSVRRAGSRVRITAQLADTTTMTNLWTQSYENMDVKDVLGIQKDVAHRIARSLALALTPPSSPAEKPSEAPPFGAYELWMRGRFFREQATEESVRRAISYFHQAIDAYPPYADAYAGIADAYRLLAAPGWEVEMPSTLLAQSKAAAERALALNPQLPQAHAAVAMIKFTYEWDLPGADAGIQEALRLNPSYAQAHQYRSGILLTMGRIEEALASARRAVELDPLSPTANTTLGVRYLYANRIAEAEEQFRKTLEISPGFAVAHWGLAQCYRAMKRTKQEIEQLQISVQLSGKSAYMRSQLAYGYARAGERAAAEAIRRELLAEAPPRYVAPYHIALIAAGLGETEEAIRWLQRVRDERSGWMPFLPIQPEFASMRQTPAFQRLLVTQR